MNLRKKIYVIDYKRDSYQIVWCLRIFYMVAYVYIAEITPKESRGMMGSTIGLTFYMGLIIAYFTNIGYAKFSVGWRVASVIMAVIAIVFTVGMKLMPHTPRYGTYIYPCLNPLFKAMY